MRNKITIRAGSILIALLCLSRPSGAQEHVPCLVFSGGSPDEQVIDLSKLNRITFGDNSLKLSSSSNPDEEEIELLYSLFHHLEIKNANPLPTGIEEIANDAEASLVYLKEINSLLIQDSENNLYSVGLFDMKGSLLHSCKVEGGATISFPSLVAGTYIAIATDGIHKLTLKFIQN